MSRSELVVTKDDLAKLKDILKETEVNESCYRERRKKMDVIQVKNIPVIAVLFKDVPMDFMDALLLEHMLKTQTIDCLTFQENARQPYNNNLCLFTCSCSPFARKSMTGRRDFKDLQFFHKLNGRAWSQSVQRNAQEQ